MKQLFRFATLLLLLSVGVGISSCSDDDDSGAGNDQSIIGTWVRSDGGYHEEAESFTFNADGTCCEVSHYYDYSTGQYQEDEEYFRYSCRNGILTIYNYESGRDYVVRVTISGNRMEMVEKDGDVFHYVRQGGSSVSPGGDGNTNTAFYIGTWYWSDEGYYEEFTFRSNGTGTYAWYDNEGDSGSESFTYTYSDGVIIMTAGDETDFFSVESVSQNKIRIDGDIYIRK